MEDDQLIAQTRHLAVTGVLSDPSASGSPTQSVPASPRSMTGSPPPARRDPSDLGGDGYRNSAAREEHDDGQCGDGRGVRLGRSTTVAAVVATGARPMEGLVDGLVDGGSEAGDATAPSPSLSPFPCPSSSSPSSSVVPSSRGSASLEGLPVEVLFHIMGFLDVNDLLSTSRASHQLRSVSLTPLLHVHRLQRTRVLLPPKLWSPSRPSLADLIARSIFLTQTTVVSRRLARSLVSIRLSRRLAARPSPETLAERAVLPRECLPPMIRTDDNDRDEEEGGKRRAGVRATMVSPALVQQRRRVEKERIKDGLRRWVGVQWRRAVREKGESVRRWEESCGVGRVWRLTRFWERVSRGEEMLG